jgi:uncharacterized protein YigE (DUF2233 family)
MKKSLLVILVLLGTAPAPKAQAIHYQRLSEGIEYGVWESGAQSRLHLLKLNLNKVRVRPIDARDFASPGLNVKDMAVKSQALAVINANFFDESGRPLGMVLQEGKLKNPFHKTEWWASLLLGKNRAKILKVFQTRQTKGFENGVQAGPRLVVAGRIPKLKNTLSPKSAVGINQKGDLILMATEGGLSTQALAEFLKRPEAAGGLGIPNALNLDGGSSTQIFIKVKDFELYIPGLSTVPIGLGVFKN